MTNKDNWEDYEELQDQINVNEESGKKKVKSQKPKKNWKQYQESKKFKRNYKDKKQGKKEKKWKRKS